MMTKQIRLSPARFGTKKKHDSSKVRCICLTHFPSSSFFYLSLFVFPVSGGKGYNIYGKQWAKVSRVVRTRAAHEVAVHAKRWVREDGKLIRSKAAFLNTKTGKWDDREHQRFIEVQSEFAREPHAYSFTACIILAVHRHKTGSAPPPPSICKKWQQTQKESARPEVGSDSY